MAVGRSFPVGHIRSNLYGYSDKTESGKVLLNAQRELRGYFSARSIQRLLLEAKNNRGILADINKMMIERANSLLKSSVAEVMNYQMNQILEELSLNIGSNIISKLVSSYNLNLPLAGQTSLQRLATINRRSLASVEKILNTDRALSWKVDQIGRFMRGTDAGVSYFRQTAKVIMSESYRGRQESSKILGKYLEGKGNEVEYIWILSSIPTRKPDICDEYARIKTFSLESIPDYPHSFCGCKVGINIKN